MKKEKIKNVVLNKFQLVSYTKEDDQNFDE